MNPEEQHEQYQAQWRANCIKGSHCMAGVRFLKFHEVTTVFRFEVKIRIWQDEDWEYGEFHDFCKNLVDTDITLNTNSYKEMSDQLYDLIATEMPGREIWIKILHENAGLTTKYDQKT
jgi:hypothetical protein